MKPVEIVLLPMKHRVYRVDQAMSFYRTIIDVKNIWANRITSTVKREKHTLVIARVQFVKDHNQTIVSHVI